MGLKGPEVLRLMGQGVMEIGATVVAYLAADDPANEMIDVAGLLPDVVTARKVTDAVRPVYEKLYRDKFGVELLGFGTYPAQVFYCNGEIKGLADIKGKKVRAAGRSQSELVAALGGTPVTLAFGEVVPALQNKTVDCAIAGTLSGNAAKWHEVTTHLLALPVSWGQIGYAVNAKTWNGWDPKLRSFIDTEMKTLKAPVGRCRPLHAAGLRVQRRHRQVHAGHQGQDDPGAAQPGRPRHAQEDPQRCDAAEVG